MVAASEPGCPMSAVFPVIPDARYRSSTASSNQTAFTVPFVFLANDDITVYKTALTGVMTQLARPANYSISGAGNDAGGTVTLKVGARAGEKILVVGTTSRTRANSVVRNGKYDSRAADEDFDRLTIIAQEHDRDIARAVKVPLGDTPPTLVPGDANTLAVWNADGDLVGGPDAAAIEALDAALGVDAGRALIFPAPPADPVYDAHSRFIRNLADGADPTDAATVGQLSALEAAIGVPAIDARFDAVELSVAIGWTTGDLKLAMSDDDQTGWLKVDARTLGDANSSATARADADCQPLFNLIWAKYDNTACHIQTSSGTPTNRGVSAAADWAAHRRLPLLAAGGEFLRILDGGRGVDTDRGLGSAQAQQLLTHGHTATFSGTAMPPHPHSIGVYDQDTGGGVAADGRGNKTADQATSSVSAGTPAGTVAVADYVGGAENRPRNIAFPLFVKL